MSTSWSDVRSAVDGRLGGWNTLWIILIPVKYMSMMIIDVFYALLTLWLDLHAFLLEKPIHVKTPTKKLLITAVLNTAKITSNAVISSFSSSSLSNSAWLL